MKRTPERLVSGLFGSETGESCSNVNEHSVLDRALEEMIVLVWEY